MTRPEPILYYGGIVLVDLATERGDGDLHKSRQ
jgi:hypothetical protein